MKSKIFKFVMILIILYLFISSIYVFKHINFGPNPKFVGMGFSESKNSLRVFMGLPKTLTTYEGVPPIYMVQVIIKICLGIILLIFVMKNNKKES